MRHVRLKRRVVHTQRVRQRVRQTTTAPTVNVVQLGSNNARMRQKIVIQEVRRAKEMQRDSISGFILTLPIKNTRIAVATPSPLGRFKPFPHISDGDRP